MKKVLIIDDDEAITSLLKRALSRTGSFAVYTAHDGEDGLQQVRLFEPDIILLDLSIPKLKGAGVFGALREEKTQSQIPVIVISGEAGMEEIYERFGALFFKKPFDVQTLVTKVYALTYGKDQDPEGTEARRPEKAAGGLALSAEESARIAKPFKPVPGKVSDAGYDIVDSGAGLRKKILMVEDDVVFSANAAVVFIRAGYDFEVLSSVKDLFEKIDTFDPDVLVIKFELHDQRGDKVVLKLREGGRHLHVVLYTLKAQRKVEKMALKSILHHTYYKSGLADVVEIPKAEALLNKVNHMFKHKAA